MIQKSDNQDLEFIVSPIIVDEVTMDPTQTSWKLKMWTNSSSSIVIEHSNGEVTSSGEIETNCVVSSTDIRIYAKGSKTPFGKGNLHAGIALFTDNANFPDGKQVIKTLDVNTGIEIV